MLNIIDEFTRECLTIRIGRKLKAVDVIDTLSDLFILRGVPGHTRSDNGPSSLPGRYVSGLPQSGRERPTSCPADRGRTAIARADGHDISRNVGELHGVERSASAAAHMVEAAWFKAIRGSSLDRPPPARNAYAMAKGRARSTVHGLPDARTLLAEAKRLIPAV